MVRKEPRPAPHAHDSSDMVVHGVDDSDSVACDESSCLKPERSTFSSQALGMIDILYCRFRECIEPSTRRWFRLGYGDLPAYFLEAQDMMLEWQQSGFSHLSQPVEILWNEWDAEQPAEGVLFDEGTFPSPFGDSLPEDSRQVRFLFVRRAHDSTLLPPTRAVYVHMAATGSTTYTERLRCLALPLLQSGIASCLLTAPYYGARSPRGQDLHYINNVADYMRQSMAMILEGTSLVRTLTSGFGPHPGEQYGAGSLVVGVTGLSWGGAMAACTALTSKLPVACMVGLGSDSPRVMAAGMISWQMDWAALQRARARSSRCEAQADLEDVFTRLTFKTLLQRGHGPTIGSVVQVAAEADHFVSAHEGAQLFESLQKAVRPDGHCELQWVPGGHGWAFVNIEKMFVPACVKAVDKAEAKWNEWWRSKQAEPLL